MARGVKPKRRKRANRCLDLHAHFWELLSIKINGIELGYSAAGVRGCYSKHDLDKGTVVFGVPQKAAVVDYLDGALQAPEGVDYKEWIGVGSYARIAFELLDRDDLREILYCLPRFPEDVPLPMFWDSAMLQDLSRLCPLASERLKDERRNWDNAFNVLQGPLRSRGLDKDDFFKALHAVCTRSFDGEELFFGKRSWLFMCLVTLCVWICWVFVWRLPFKAVHLSHLILPAVVTQILGSLACPLDRKAFRAFIPGLDLINHSSLEPSVAVKFDELACQFQVRCCTSVPASCELRFSYGESTSNDEFLLRFGFVEGDNPNDVLDISLQTLSELGVSGEVSKLRQHGLEQLHFSRGGVLDAAYLRLMGLNSIHTIAARLRSSIEKSLGKSDTLLRRYKVEKMRLLDEVLDATATQQR